MNEEKHIKELYAQHCREMWERIGSDSDSPDPLDDIIRLSLLHGDLLEHMDGEQQKLFLEFQKMQDKVYQERQFQAFRDGYISGRNNR